MHFPNKKVDTSFLNYEFIRAAISSNQPKRRSTKGIESNQILVVFRPLSTTSIVFLFCRFSLLFRRRIISYVKDAITYYSLICSCKLFKRYFASTLDLRWTQEERITFYAFLYVKRGFINVKRFKVQYENRYLEPIETGR